MLDAAQTLIGAHRDGGIGVGGRQVGADGIDAVERILFAGVRRFTDVGSQWLLT